jgi:hypothetical protein
MSSLSLTELFFLLSFDSRKRVFANLYYTEKFNYGLCGALLFELILSKRLVFTEDKELVEDKNAPTNRVWVAPLLEKIEKKQWFTILFGKKHQKTLANWLKVFKAHVYDIRQGTRQYLDSEKIIGKKTSKIFGLKLYSSTYLENLSLLQSLKQDLLQTILGTKSPEIQNLMLLRLIKGLKATKNIFLEKTALEKKELEQKLNQLFEQEEIIRTLQDLLLEIQKQEKWEDVLDSLDVISEAIESIGDAVDGIGDGGDGGSDGGDGGGD